jgi:predicted TIM-barrel fold metal-dependent hydrolase
MSVQVSGEAGKPLVLRVADTDVHHGMWETSGLYPYLSRVHRERLAEYGFGAGGGLFANNGGRQGFRADILRDRQPTAPGAQAPDPELCRRELLDGAGVDVALLVGGGGEIGSTAGPDVAYSSALIRAFNDYSVQEWLTVDERFRLAIAVSVQDPRAAADEVDRLGDHPQVVSVILPCGATRPYGQEFYRPLHEACARRGLAITLHFGLEGSGVNPAPTAAGWPSSYVQARMMRPSFYMVHLSSFVFDGVFEQFPNLKVGMIETGVAWIPDFMWRMDQNWKALRWQVPWVKRLPSDYIREHVRFCSQPLDEPGHRGAMDHILEWVGADRLVMFSSDYPHFDWDEPRETLAKLPLPLRQRIMWDNAAELYGF